LVGKWLSVRFGETVLFVVLLGEERKRRGGAERGGPFICPQPGDKPVTNN
jgi:hypothetical protein